MTKRIKCSKCKTPRYTDEYCVYCDGADDTLKFAWAYLSYIESLEAAGAVVLADASFGSYQGDWLALVDYKGKRGFVHGSYGSCSGCDAFEAEFGYSYEGCGEHRFNAQSKCAECKEEMDSYQTRLAEFGRGYLEYGDGEVDLQDYDNTLANLSRNAEWDYEAPQMIAWIKSIKDIYDTPESGT